MSFFACFFPGEVPHFFEAEVRQTSRIVGLSKVIHQELKDRRVNVSVEELLLYKVCTWIL